MSAIPIYGGPGPDPDDAPEVPWTHTEGCCPDPNHPGWWLCTGEGHTPNGDPMITTAQVGHFLSEYLDDDAPLNERRYVRAAEALLKKHPSLNIKGTS